MINFHKWMLIGILFLFFDIWIFIDIIPDFLGAFFIAYAFSNVESKYAKWGFWSAAILGVLFMPSTLAEVGNATSNQLPAWIVISNNLMNYVTVLMSAAFLFDSNERIGKRGFGKFALAFTTLQILIIGWDIVLPHVSYTRIQELDLVINLFFLCFTVMFIALIVQIWKRMKLEDTIINKQKMVSTEEAQ